MRFFAAARAATGRDTLELEDIGGPPTLAEALDAATELVRSDGALTPTGSDLERVLSRCSFLVDGLATTDRTVELASGATVDVLPPFAGG
ncbi:MoaD/ThiS family protein [Marisediminicola sp. LYQ134]|uniref:MoaD/ThiS family protein n=1 Tax=Marisediminicola sp. LYQ134 TaxID=3391061 RepID=UPI0039834087